MKAFFIITLTAFLLSACSSYKTSVKNLRFTDVRYTEKPVIPIDPDYAIGNESITFLGAVDAYVKRPSISKPLPTEAQAAYVLAAQAKQRGANAVLHATYKPRFSVWGQNQMQAHGQAVRIEAKAYAQMIQALRYYEKPVENTDGITYRQEEDARKAGFYDKTDSAELSVAKPRGTTATKPIEQPVIVSEPLAGETTTVPPVSKYTLAADKEEWRDRTRFMLSNAQYLQKQAKANKDFNAASAAERLINLLEQQLEYFSDKKKQP